MAIDSEQSIDQSLNSNDVLFDEINQTGLITLNRPQALNALNFKMIIEIKHRLETWINDANIQLIVIKSNSSRCFSAGGDLKDVYQAIKNKDKAFLQDFFKTQYQLDCLLHTYPKPVVTFVNGIIMGGGMGLSMHTSLRIFSQTITAAMPETSLGFFPDVGATYFLNRAPHNVGHYFGLTGLTADCETAFFLQFATHIVPYEKHDELCDRLVSAVDKSLSELNRIVMSFEIKIDTVEIEKKLIEMGRLFSANSIQELLNTLQESTNPVARQALEILHQRSPASLYFTHRQLNFQHWQDIRQVMNIEFNLSQYMCQYPDFFEGIRAAVIDKDKQPIWQKTLTVNQYDIEKISTSKNII